MGTARILSQSDEPFRDRVDAGRQLGRELRELRGQDVVVLGIPRGGVTVAREVARELDAELDVVFSRKLGAPGNPELAIGAVAEDGRVFTDESLLRQLRVTPVYLERETAHQMAEIGQRSARFRAARPRATLAGRVVVVTDDGLATGSTMLAALWSVRQEGPAKLICAVPVGPESAVREMARHADEALCLRAPRYFGAVGRFYLDFEQVSDEEVLEALREARRAPAPAV